MIKLCKKSVILKVCFAFFKDKIIELYLHGQKCWYSSVRGRKKNTDRRNNLTKVKMNKKSHESQLVKIAQPLVRQNYFYKSKFITKIMNAKCVKKKIMVM